MNLFQIPPFASAAVLLLLVVPLHDALPGRARLAFDHALALYHHGRLAQSQKEAEWGFREFQLSEPDWALRFLRLQAEVMVWRGMDAQALQLLAVSRPDPADKDQTIHALTIEGQALIHRRQFSQAAQRLAQAESLCKQAQATSCGETFKTLGNLACDSGDSITARQRYLQTYAFAQTHHDAVLETISTLDLGNAAINLDHFDEAIEWSRMALKSAQALGDEDLALTASGNLGLAYGPFGDTEQSRQLFLESAHSAARLGDLRSQMYWIEQVGKTDFYSLRYSQAIESHRQALDLARHLDNKQMIAFELESVAQAQIETGKLDEASALLDQAKALQQPGDDRDTRTQTFLQAELATARLQNVQAEALYRKVLANTRSQADVQTWAARGLGEVLQRQGRNQEAEVTYKTAVAAFEAKRARTKGVSSQLSLLTYGTPLYSGYINLLAQQGRAEEALLVANQSRAQTLAHSLDTSSENAAPALAALHPRQIAQKTGATLLFYWLGRKQSYLWAVTPQKISLFELPPELEIIHHILPYRKALMDMQDPLATNNQDARELYSILVAPVAGLLTPNAPVILLDDAMLSKLNFETLLAPGKSLGQPASTGSHYWIEDVTLRSAPSLSALAVPESTSPASARLLLMGDAVSPSEDYPDLPMAPMEMKLIRNHFSASTQTVFVRAQATPAAYLASSPERFAYLHFVTHGIASSSDPLDSSIVLSRSNDQEGAFKLYARDILQHPLHARLVTISACYGSGSRSYSGEGLVGLSWAFLGAGAHNVIGALWEVSDESTPRLMDSLYQGLEANQQPAVALRRAKLALLHSTGSFRNPFFWAPFQIYTGH